MGRLDMEASAALALLGLTSAASAAEVTAAYRRLARETHPDRCAEPSAAERFDALSTAYRRALALVEPPASSSSHSGASRGSPGAAEPPREPPEARPRRWRPVQFAAGPVYWAPSPGTPARGSRRG